MQPAGPTIDDDGAVHLPPITVPFSCLASVEAKEAFIASREGLRKLSADIARYPEISAENIQEQRQALLESFKDSLVRTRSLYPVRQEDRVIAGVPCEVFTPAEQMAKTSPPPILINLHAGTFLMGARVFSALESIPLASLGGFTVISVDYRMGPEHKFPAATEDVAAVYQDLLGDHRAGNIGVYGCSAGGLLTAQTVALLCTRGIPLPGAVGILSSSACGWPDGDSGSLGMRLGGLELPAQMLAPPHREVYNVPYFSDADMDDPLVFPIRSQAILRSFPPTLLITATRDSALSGAAHTHAQLIKNGVEADLHVWDGLSHAFFCVSPDLPETMDAWTTVARFFDRHLGSAKRNPE